jgi:hypothetical protein
MAAGNAAQVGRPIIAVLAPTPAALAASSSSMICRALPQTRITSGTVVDFLSGA